MPDKKILVKVPKKSNPAKEEAKKGVYDKEASAENKIELTKQYSDAQDSMKKNLESDKGKSLTEKSQGVSINKDSMEAKPKVFKRKIVKAGGENGTTRIMSSDGKTVKYEGRSNMQATKDAVKQNEKQTADTNARRSSNANYYNVNSGAKTDLSEKDKETLVRNSKAVKK